MLPRPPRPTPLPYPPLCRSSRGGRPPAFDREVYKHRNVVERCFNRLKQWRGIATRYDKTAQSYEAAVTLASLLIDRKSTRLNSSHANISYAVFCLKKITLLSLPENVAVVLHETLVFDVTRRANICYCTPGARGEEIRGASLDADADEFLDPLTERS